MSESQPENGALYLHPDDGHTIDCTALVSGGWKCSTECPEHHLALARAVHRLRFPHHADCEPNPIEVRHARRHLEALASIDPSIPPGSSEATERPGSDA